MQRVIAACDGPNQARNRAILLVSYNLGLRAKELASLTIGDMLDADGRLNETIRLLKHMTKGAKFREVFLVHDATRQTLEDYLSHRGRRGGDRPLFLSQKGQPFSANSMQRLMGQLYHNAHILGSSHSGRRSFATRLIERGADIYAIKELMGHESITTTQAYFFASPERLKKISKLLG